MSRLSTCALLAFLAFATVAVEGHPENARRLVIGLLGPYSPESPLYSTAIAIRQGAELALSAYIDSTRVHVDFITADSDCSAALSQKAAEHLIENGANVILGDICSGATLNASIITNMAQTVLISPASTSPTLTEKGGKYFFRTAPSDAFQGTYMYNHINGTKVLTLNSEEPYGSGIAKTLAAQFTSDTKTLVGQLTFPESGFAGSVDLSGKPDTVAVLTNDIVSAVKIIKDLKDQGFSGQIFGSDSLLSVDIITQSAGAAEGMIVTTPTLGIPEFQFMYESVYGTAYKPYAAQAADAVIAVSKAFMKGGYKVKNIAKKLREVNFNGAIGKVAFDQNGDLKQPVVYQLFQVVDGEFVAK